MLLCAVIQLLHVNAEAPSGYYSRCEGKYGAALLSSLEDVIGSHTNVGYDGLWNVYKTSDVYPSDGKIWDMYSTKHWPVNGERCGNYKNVGDCYNREHSFPKSWFSEASPMKSDAFHIYPTDGKVNGQRSNHPYGECEGGTTLSAPGGIKALGRLGKSTFSGYSGTVFEPDDQYKGDFARSYFYMAACYNGRISGWNSDMLSGNPYPAFRDWAVKLLLKWHREDPVSQKEIDRNDAVYAYQHNRNPFIDHPELAEHIWGDHKTTGWVPGGVVESEILLPVNGNTLDLGAAGVGYGKSSVFTVRGKGLTQAVSLSVSGNGFSVSPSQISASTANSVSGGTATVSFSSTVTGEHTGTLTVRSGSEVSVVALKVAVYDGIPVSSASNVGEDSFTARWTYVGGDTGGNYTLEVTSGGVPVAGYPKAVNARAQQSTVYGLEPMTEYAYRVSSASATSQWVSVTTTEPVPYIDFLYDGDLVFEAMPGEPSGAEEILADIANIDTDITIEIDAPFQLSTDRTNWGTRIVLDPEADRFYIRIYGDTPGSYHGTLKAQAGGYINDDVEVAGTVGTPPAAFLETFETEKVTSGYGTTSYDGTACRWSLGDAGVFADPSPVSGKQNMRFGKTPSSRMAMDEDKPYGIGIVTFHAAAWGSDERGKIEVEYSLDNGATWEPAGTADVDSENYKKYTFTVNKAGAGRIRLRQTSGKRFKIDDIAITDFRQSGIDGVESDYRSWDAFCRGGKLIIENTGNGPRTVRVYGVDGIAYHTGVASPGETALSLPVGLYIVAVDDFTRRVVVK